MDIIFPSGMFGANSQDSFLSAVLRQVGLKYALSPNEWVDPSKYGCDFENDVFLMHQDCPGCFQEDPNDPEAWGWTDGAIGGCMWCRCRDLENLLEAKFGTKEYSKYAERQYYDPPNFWWKPTDFRIKWYKYIGREMASNRDFSQDEIATISLQLLGRTLEQVAEIHASDSRGRAEELAEMLKSVGNFGGIFE